MAGTAGENSQVNISIVLQNIDLLIAAQPVTISRTVPLLTYRPSNAVYFDVLGVSTNTSLIFLGFYAVLYVRNLAFTSGATITLAATFNNGAAQSIFLPAGSVFLYGPAQPIAGGGAPNGNGITNLLGTSSTPSAPGGGSPIELYGAF